MIATGTEEVAEEYLYDRLLEYSRSDMYPFHMPGHKRRMGAMADPAAIDITEIDGFDNLHHAEGIIRDVERRAAHLYGAAETCLLVGGSTAGILTAVSAAMTAGGMTASSADTETMAGGAVKAAGGAAEAAGADMKPGRSGAARKILVARNCHKAVYHALYLRHLEPVYVSPQERGVINGPVLAEDVERILEREEGIGAVVITSPTYDGVVSDATAIARAAHRHHAVLIVDEAHGAHFGMDPAWPQSAVRLGADYVIQSLHKTLPALGQTALLHLSGAEDVELAHRFSGIYQTSSPSYVLMASADRCLRWMKEQGREAYAAYAGRLEHFYRECRDLRSLKLIRTDDPSRIIIRAPEAAGGGLELSRQLREQDHLEMEMAAPQYVLALSTVADDEEALERLGRALHRIDDAWAAYAKEADGGGDRAGAEAGTAAGCAYEAEGGKRAAGSEIDSGAAELSDLPEYVMAPAEAWDGPRRACALEQTAGCVSAEMVYLYPPGIPLLVPGERIDEAMQERLLKLRDQGWSLQGMMDRQMQTLKVVYEQ